MKSTTATAAAQPIPLAMFQELVAQYHHRLLSLEADLKDKARHGGMPTGEFAKRVKRLKQVHAELSLLQRLCVAEAPNKLASANDIGLPLMEDCTPEERQVCEQFLAEKARDTERLAGETASVLKWVDEAMTGKSGWLRITLRLSRLRRLIQTYDRRSETLQATTKAMATHVDRLLSLVGKSGAHKGLGREAGKSMLEGLMTLFQSLDATIARVAKLRAAVKQEDARTKAMADWLRKEETERVATSEVMHQPSPLAVSRATRNAFAEIAPHNWLHQHRRRDLLEHFQDDILGKGTVADPKVLAEAAALLRQAQTTHAHTGDRQGSTSEPARSTWHEGTRAYADVSMDDEFFAALGDQA